MKFSTVENICDNCIGENACNKYCTLHAGKALVDFLSGIDITRTHIGDYESRERNGKKDLVCFGHKLWEVEQPAHLLGDIKTVLDSEPKFKGYFNLSPNGLMDAYCKKHDISEEDIEQLHSMTSDMTKNRIIALPIKPHMECLIDINKSIEAKAGLLTKKKTIDGKQVDGEEEKAAVKETKAKTKDRYETSRVNYVVWRVNSTTHKLDCTVAFRVGPKNNEKTYTFSMCDYMDAFKINLESVPSAMDKKLIKMTNYGIVRPIEMTDGETTIAIDGSFVYDVQGSIIRVIGHWVNSRELKITGGEMSNVLKKLLDNKEVVRSHRRYIAPYILYPSNLVEVRKSKGKE